MLVPPSHPPHVTRRIDARLVWMHERQLEIGRQYLLKHTSQTVQAVVNTVRYRVNINTLEKESGFALGLNDIGAVVLETQKPIFADPYRRNHATGSFILVDPMSNATVAAGMITGRDPSIVPPPEPEVPAADRRVTTADQQSRAGHRVVTIWLETPPEAAHQLERLLFDANCRVHALPAADAGAHLPDLTRVLNDAGVIALVYGTADPQQLERISLLVGEQNLLRFDASLSTARIYQLLQDEGIVSRFAQGD
jgi:hypothetical protein